MRSGLGDLDIAVWRLTHSGESGLNLSISDLYGKEIECPSLREIIMTFLTNKPIRIRVKGQPAPVVNRLEQIQDSFDKKVKKEIDEARRKANI